MSLFPKHATPHRRGDGGRAHAAVNLSHDVHKLLRIAAIERGVSAKDLAEAAIVEFIKAAHGQR